MSGSYCVSNTIKSAIQIQEKNLKDIMVTGCHLTQTALVGASDVDFWIVMQYETSRMEIDIIKDQRAAILTIEMVDKRGRILLFLKWDAEDIDLSIIPEKAVGPQILIVVKGMLMKKVVFVNVNIEKLSVLSFILIHHGPI